MAADDTHIIALNPDPAKQGTRVTRARYEQVKAALLAALDNQPEIPFKDLAAAVEAHLSEPLDGSVGWWTTTVKLDLEARGILERVPGRSPQVVRRAQA